MLSEPCHVDQWGLFDYEVLVLGILQILNGMVPASQVGGIV